MSYPKTVQSILDRHRAEAMRKQEKSSRLYFIMTLHKLGVIQVDTTSVPENIPEWHMDEIMFDGILFRRMPGDAIEVVWIGVNFWGTKPKRKVMYLDYHDPQSYLLDYLRSINKDKEKAVKRFGRQDI